MSAPLFLSLQSTARFSFFVHKFRSPLQIPFHHISHSIITLAMSTLSDDDESTGRGTKRTATVATRDDDELSMTSLPGLSINERKKYFIRAMKKIEKDGGNISPEDLIEIAAGSPTEEWVILFGSMSKETMTRNVKFSKNARDNNISLIEAKVEEGSVLTADLRRDEASLQEAQLVYNTARTRLAAQQQVHKDAAKALSANQLELQQLILMHKTHSFFVAYGNQLINTPDNEKPFGKPNVTINDVKNRIKIKTWEVIVVMKASLIHAIINVLAAHGYFANSDFQALWQKYMNNKAWIARNGTQPNIATGRVKEHYKLAVRLADYLDIPVPDIPTKVTAVNCLPSVNEEEDDDSEEDDNLKDMIAKLQARGYDVTAKTDG
jgi:hypothetical protein